MDPSQLRSEIARLGPWHHDVEIAPGIRTGERQAGRSASSERGMPSLITPEPILRQLIGDVLPEGLQGRSFLDCACNGGGYLLAASRMGAGRIFGFDVRAHWIAQARFLAERFPETGMELATCDLAALADLDPPPFDITLFSGLFYHLPDPVAGLASAASRTKELLILNTATAPGATDALRLNLESDAEPMSGVHRLAWLPTGSRVLRAILGWCGFAHARLLYEVRTGKRGRLVLLAAREAATFAHYDLRHPERPSALGERVGRWLRRALRS